MRKEQKEMNNTSVAADGQALKDDCYYLKELNGICGCIS